MFGWNAAGNGALLAEPANGAARARHSLPHPRAAAPSQRVPTSLATGDNAAPRHRCRSQRVPDDCLATQACRVERGWAEGWNGRPHEDEAREAAAISPVPLSAQRGEPVSTSPAHPSATAHNPRPTQNPEEPLMLTALVCVCSALSAFAVGDREHTGRPGANRDPAAR